MCLFFVEEVFYYKENDKNLDYWNFCRIDLLGC